MKIAIYFIFTFLLGINSLYPAPKKTKAAKVTLLPQIHSNPEFTLEAMRTNGQFGIMGTGFFGKTKQNTLNYIVKSQLYLLKKILQAKREKGSLAIIMEGLNSKNIEDLKQYQTLESLRNKKGGVKKAKKTFNNFDEEKKHEYMTKSHCNSTLKKTINKIKEEQLDIEKYAENLKPEKKSCLVYLGAVELLALSGELNNDEILPGEKDGNEEKHKIAQENPSDAHDFIYKEREDWVAKQVKKERKKYDHLMVVFGAKHTPSLQEKIADLGIDEDLSRIADSFTADMSESSCQEETSNMLGAAALVTAAAAITAYFGL